MDAQYLKQLLAEYPANAVTTEDEVLWYTPPSRLLFHSLDDLRPAVGKTSKRVEDGARYGGTLMLADGADVMPLRKAQGEAAKAAWPTIATDGFKRILRQNKDRDKPIEGFGSDTWGLNFNSQFPITILDRDGVTILDPKNSHDVYDGMWLVAAVVFYSYETGGKGVGCGGRALMKVGDDEAIKGGGPGEAVKHFKPLPASMRGVAAAKANGAAAPATAPKADDFL